MLPLDRPNGAIAIHGYDQEIALRPRVFQVLNMPWMEQVKDPRGETDTAPLTPFRFNTLHGGLSTHQLACRHDGLSHKQSLLTERDVS